MPPDVCDHEGYGKRRSAPAALGPGCALRGDGAAGDTGGTKGPALGLQHLALLPGPPPAGLCRLHTPGSVPMRMALQDAAHPDTHPQAAPAQRAPRALRARTSPQGAGFSSPPHIAIRWS